MSTQAIIGGPALSDPVTQALFGGDYLGWTGLPGWTAQADALGVGHVRWPGGIVAEDLLADGVRAYDLTAPDLTDGWPRWDGTARPGLTDMMAFARDTGRGLSVLVPTARYVEMAATDRDAALALVRDEVGAFATRLVAGHYGTVPDRMILEVGAEYYSTDIWEGAGGDPAVRDLFADVFAAAVGALDAARAGTGAFEIAVQSGRFQSRDDPDEGPRDGEAADSLAFLDAYHAAGVTDAIDALIWHRYTYHWSQVPTHFRETAHPDNAMSTLLADHLALWSDALGSEPDLVVGWAAPDVDSTGASAVDPWFDFGPRAAGNLLQMLSEMASAGVDVATLYGIDSPWPGAVSTGGTSRFDNHVTFAGEAFALAAESVIGMAPLGIHATNAWTVGPDNVAPATGDVDFYAFAGDGRRVVLARAQEFEGDRLTAGIALSDMTAGLARAVRLTPDGDDANAGGIRSDASFDWTDDGVTFDFGQPWEVMRVEVATDAAAALDDRTETWTGRDGLTVAVIPETEPWPPEPPSDLLPDPMPYADDFVF